MSHLVEVYAKDLGVKIGRPIFIPHYTPLPFKEKRYITLHNSEKIPAKNYAFWAEFVFLFKKFAPQFSIVQVGHGEKPIEGIDVFFNGTIKQSSFVIQNAALHVGVDSGPVHIASALNTPIVSLYSNSRPENAGPLWNTAPAICIESNRGGRICSAANDENPSTINMIMPEEILKAASEILGFPIPAIKIINIGPRYKERYNEILPALPPAFATESPVIRVDVLQEFAAPETWPTIEQNTFDYLSSSNSAGIVIAKILSKSFLDAARHKIGRIIWVAENFDAEEYKYATKLGIPQEYLCVGDASKERFKNLELEITSYDEEKKIRENKESLGEKFSRPNLQFKTNRTVICGPHSYPGIQHWAAENGVKKEYFWLDSEFFWVYSEGNGI